MGDDRTRILDLLAAGKITAEEAARLLDALQATPTESAEADGSTAAETKAETKGGSSWPKFFSGAKTGEKGGTSGAPKFMFVKVVSTKGDNVNVKIPLALVRAGLKLTSLIPPQAAEQINKTMAEKGMSFDLTNFKPEDFEDLIESLREMEVDVDSADGDKIHVYAA